NGSSQFGGPIFVWVSKTRSVSKTELMLLVCSRKADLGPPHRRQARVGAWCSQRRGRQGGHAQARAAASGPNLTFRFAWGFSSGLACVSLRNAQANKHTIDCRRPQLA